jgi:trigger factor
MTNEEIAKTFTQKELPDSEVELVGEIPFESIAPLENKALEHFQAEIELPGFRKGHVPLDMVKKRVGEIAVLEEAVELFMRDFYVTLVDSRSIDAVGRPTISITKLAPGNPVGISIRTAVYPNIELPKKWGELGKSVEVETVPDILDAELDEALTSIRRARYKADAAPTSEGVGEPTDNVGSESPTIDPSAPVAEENLPALDDAFAQSLGDFKDLVDLKEKLRANMKNEKEVQAKDKRRGKIIEALLEKTPVAVPVIFVDSELEKILGQMKEDVSRFGLSFEDYLKQSNKTEEQVRDDFRHQARKRAQLQLILNKIADDEKILADKEAVDHEMQHALQHFPDARPDLLRIHIETVLRNEKVLRRLEGEDISTPSPISHEGHDHSDPNHTH